ncbi:NADH:ubiquinone oxidoreductase, subunit C [Denitrovibrio acetiphilus DSM 12809]|uniref:Na(+)-translocating NADH-quinone reductase subunit C n=1 Tax=Denitrovibrio acetiphilus (strain DSM 12809 / NBRC 114555 / N2460) TaxID=522772 RepID=D4H1M3_DENA2|nr:Na(+)-translocating NADH-quinone reductase subunit C [Denitrovibrio acetiphilus]ADD68783.1 NADH:ubiquinone oxidoreductase, subunit C [Denitrovibrio acetiphilus DSM 12809]
MQRESDLRTFVTAFVLAVICSFLVSGAAVVLKPLQTKNKELERKKNVLIAGGLYQEGTDIQKVFESIEIVFADMKTGEQVKGNSDDYFNNFQSLSTGAESISIPKKEDLAGIRSIPPKVPVFLLKNNDGSLKNVIIPIYGSGLWSTMYGFLALEPDFNTVSGITFYEHGETPGLGGEIENPQWQQKWKGKEVYSGDGEVALSIVKGGARGEHQIDSLSGATLTSRGVQGTVRFWMGDKAFGKFFNKMKKGGA